MANTLGILEVPPNRIGRAARDRSATRRFAGTSLIEWVIRRISDSMLLDEVAVVAPTETEPELRRLLPSDVNLLVGDCTDSLGRLAKATRKYDASQVVRIRLDSPFVDPQLIDRLICKSNSFPGCDYLAYSTQDGVPALRSPLGLFAECCRSAAVLQADREATHPEERREATRYIFTRPELFQIRLIPVPAELDRSDLRLTLNAEEDWAHADVILDALGPDDLDWQSITGLLNEHPDIRQRMADLNRITSS